ncbi:PREDICTED: uncharacterized protein LOC108567453 [Nicrophorus vespilloides]|uniref:Uncharacterized protein LOC108567453 n=1 Tax=Nicrophorus vespilloides TaxID=110193 RepID=A0ABM1N9C9_NICVS|nr:PREDICTED: uncharacterized protein LOC108567453 [Nicrophorus vespilloides]
MQPIEDVFLVERGGLKRKNRKKRARSASTCSHSSPMTTDVQSNAMLHKLFPWKHNKTKIMAEPVLEEDVNLEEKLTPCGICGRTFLPKPLAKHEIVCEKNATKKRKIFNSLKQRVEGTDLAHFHQRTYLKKPEIVEEIPKSAWKEKHQQLVNAIRAAKSAPQRIDHIHTKRVPVTSSGCERCPTCDRQFGPKAFDRHVEWCKERKARLPQSPANIMQAKERLEARIKYRVPPLNKPKRSVKEKYQSPYRNENIPVSRSTGNLDRKPSIRRDGGSTLNLKPVKPESRSPEARSETPKAKVEAAKRQETYDPYKTAHKQFLELLDEDQDTIKPTLVVTKKKKPTKRASVIDPPCDFRDNFELIENFINENLNDENLLKKLDFDSISLSSNKTTFSETTLYEIDPRLINEFDNLSIPDILPTDENSPSPPKKSLVPRKTKTPNVNRSSSIRSASPRDRIKNLNTLKKSITVLDTVKPKNLKNKEDVQNFLYEREISRSPKKKPDVVPVPVADDLFSIDDEMYEEYKRYEQMYLQEKEEKMRKEQKMHSEEETISKISGDSAYGSLSRNKPKVRTKVVKLSPLEHESQTSSGSEICISAKTIASAMKHPQTNFSSNKDTGGGCCSGKMTKFCHECGNKYPVTTAKFCVECGVRRLVL